MCNKANTVKRFYVLIATQAKIQATNTIPLTLKSQAITVFKNPISAITTKAVIESYLAKSERKELFSQPTDFSVVPVDIPRHMFFP
jgi:cobalamin-dependent methionine synthase I